MNKVSSIDQELIDHFLNHGFTHSWDFSKSTSEIWNEFYFGGKLICQIDIGCRLEHLFEDLKQWSIGEEPTSDGDYKIMVGNQNNFDLLLKKLNINN